VPETTTFLAAGLAAAYSGLVIGFGTRKRPSEPWSDRHWLWLTLSAAAIQMAVALLPRDAHLRASYERFFPGELTQPALAIIASNAMLVLFGAHLLSYLRARRVMFWFAAGLVWWAAQAIASILTPASGIGEVGWYGAIYDPLAWPNSLALGGWLLGSMLLMRAAMLAFHRARLPELANRALFAAAIIPLVAMGVGLAATGEDVLIEIGWLMQLAGLIGATYSASTYRVLDIRRTVRQTAATGLLTLLVAVFMFGVAIVASAIGTASEGRFALLGALALLGAALAIPVYNLFQAALARILNGASTGIPRQLNRFSETITGVVELDELVDLTMHTLRDVLRVRRGGFLLVTAATGDTLTVEPVPAAPGDRAAPVKAQLSRQSAICRQLLERREPLLQYDLDFNPSYADVTDTERQFFAQLRMSAYAPVVVENQMIGIVCCGSKVMDDPFTDHDLDLLMTIANQTGIALRSASLIADLRRRELELLELNRALSLTKEQLEKLDNVKTDFITIASHELRTPLTQIRGYTGLMEAMNEDGMLDQDQIAGMTDSMRRAADRLEELITAMLDVSQIDVNAMDLHFSPVKIESMMRTAIEPLTEAIRQRKLMVSARGLRALPPIYADQYRLVQAFRNVILNAIKYTPDGGRIDITGTVEDSEIVIAIRDSGIGIDPANHELVFEKFFRAQDPAFHSTGTTKFMGAGPGLGLTIARGVVLAHGGRIWVESERYDPESCPGSTFYIALPITPPDHAERLEALEATVSLNVRTLRDAVRGQPGQRPPGDAGRSRRSVQLSGS